jgi:beta-lactam-binding protein with PASTA domain
LPANNRKTAEKGGLIAQASRVYPIFAHVLAIKRNLYIMWEKIRRLGVEIYCFFTAPFVVKNCLGILTIGGGLFMMTFWWLKCYTNHGESIQVPNYIGMNLQEAARKALDRDFNVEVSDSIFIPGKAPGEITMQDPAPESRVKEGRTIYFTVTKNNPDIIKLPDLTGGSDDYDLYSKKCTRLGLKPRVLARVADPKLEPNTIVDVIYNGDTITHDIRYGFKVEMGATIDFIVSEQVTLTVTMPDCVCQTYDAAKFLITASNLSVGSVIKDATVTDEENAYVWRQNPKFTDGATMRVGEQIDLYLTQEAPEGCNN